MTVERCEALSIIYAVIDARQMHLKIVQFPGGSYHAYLVCQYAKLLELIQFGTSMIAKPVCFSLAWPDHYFRAGALLEAIMPLRENSGLATRD